MTGYRLLLIAPVFVLLMQVALSLHHHHTFSYHDEQDSLHSYSDEFYPDHIKQDMVSCPPANIPLYASFCLRELLSDRYDTPITVLIVDPSQSRAPPIV